MSEEPEFCRTQCEEVICSPGCHVKPEHRIGAAIAQPAKGHYCPTCNTADEWLIMCGRAESNVRSGFHKVDGEWRFEGDPEDFATILSESAKITQQIHAKQLADLEATNADLTARNCVLSGALEEIAAGTPHSNPKFAINDMVRIATEALSGKTWVLSELEKQIATLTARCARLAAELERQVQLWQMVAYFLAIADANNGRMPFVDVHNPIGDIEAALTADDKALAERWRAMEEEHRTCQEWLNFIEAHDNDADADWESLESENVKLELAWRAAVRAVSALAASLGG